MSTFYLFHGRRHQDSSVGLVTRLRTGTPENSYPVSDRRKIFPSHFPNVSRPSVVSTHISIQRVRKELPLTVKWYGYKLDHSPPCTAELTNEWNCATTPSCSVMACTSVAMRLVDFVFIFIVFVQRYLNLILLEVSRLLYVTMRLILCPLQRKC